MKTEKADREERVEHTPRKIQRIREGLQKVYTTFGDSYNNPDAYDIAHADFLATAPEDVDFLLAEREELVSALRAALGHVEELRDAWQRGALDELDGKGGTRSNRNIDVEAKIRAALQAAGA